MNPLTVRELIALLQKHPQDAKVWIGTPYQGAGTSPLTEADVSFLPYDGVVQLQSPL